MLAESLGLEPRSPLTATPVFKTGLLPIRVTLHIAKGIFILRDITLFSIGLLPKPEMFLYIFSLTKNMLHRFLSTLYNVFNVYHLWLTKLAAWSNFINQKSLSSAFYRLGTDINIIYGCIISWVLMHPCFNFLMYREIKTKKWKMVNGGNRENRTPIKWLTAIRSNRWTIFPYILNCFTFMFIYYYIFTRKAILFLIFFYNYLRVYHFKVDFLRRGSLAKYLN